MTTKPAQQTVDFTKLYGPFLYYYVAKILGFTPAITKVERTHICLCERKGAHKQFHPMNSPHLNKLIQDFRVSVVHNESTMLTSNGLLLLMIKINNGQHMVLSLN